MKYFMYAMFGIGLMAGLLINDEETPSTTAIVAGVVLWPVLVGWWVGVEMAERLELLIPEEPVDGK